MTNQGERFDRIDDAIERLSQRTNERFDSLTHRVDGLTQYVLDFREEAMNRLRLIESRLDLQAATLTSIDSRLPALTKAVLDAGTFSSQLAVELSRQKGSAADFASRLEKLEETVATLVKPAA
jgi:vacuolar-type H+-ATPase subunit I/STV1